MSLAGVKLVRLCAENIQQAVINTSRPVSSLGRCWHRPLWCQQTPAACGGATNLDGVTQSYVQRRNYMRKKTIKILPTKPLSFDYGGDLIKETPTLDLDKPQLDLDGAEELENVDEIIKKLLSMEFADGHEKQRRRIHDLVSKVQEHPLDLKSLEVRIACQTVTIRNHIKHCLEFRKDKAAKSKLVIRIQSRRKHLRKLRNKDLDKFNWLCEELQLQYTPVPMYNRKVSKRAKLKAEAKAETFRIKKEKKAAFLEKLEQEKALFDIHKEQELKDIAEKLGVLKLDKNSHLEKVFRAMKEGKVELIDEKPQHPQKRREMILERKFEIAAKLLKEREAKM